MSDSSPKPTTTDAGIPVHSDEYSLTVGPQGPILLQDHYLIEQMANFNRERIPERQAHAKGGGAFGHFHVTQDVSQYTKAAVFQPGSDTEMLARFSTVAGERGSLDTWRDPRGFALKFYTPDGNYDMVGNNTPVFFVRDPMKFQHFIRSQTRRADVNLRDHDMQWDFWTLSPETAHQRDLYEAIKRGDYPSWTLYMQIMPFDEADDHRFNPFDLTKVWPHGDYPLIEVGRMTLDRSPADYHTEIEQAAFEPNNIAPGIGFSPDKMLLARVFSYADAHRARMGVNYKQIPVNRPKVPVNSYSKEGAMRIDNVQDPVYAPNSMGGPQAEPARNPYAEKWAARGEFMHAAYTSHKDDDDFVQAGTLVREVMDDAARDRLVSNVVGHLKKGVSRPVLERAFDYWRKIDESTGNRIAEAFENG